MRVYFVSSGLEGCYNVRCLFPLVEAGWDGDRTSFVAFSKTPENKSLAAQQADVVVFHRPDDDRKLKLARLLKQQGKKIVFDNDDTLKDDGGFKMNAFLDKKRMKKGLEKMDTLIDTFIREADLVTCSTQFLADEYKKINSNVAVLPNCVDPFLFDTPLRNESDTVRVGLTGSIGCTSDFDVAVDIVRAVPDVRWVLFSLPPQGYDKITQELYAGEYETLSTLDIEWQTFVTAEEYYDTLNNLRLDIMSIPRADNYFNRAKSNLKFLEASMLEIPCVAQGFQDGLSPYQADTEDARHMVIAHNTEEFVRAIHDLSQDKDRRREIGKKAKEYVLEKYSITNNIHLWEKAYQNLFQRTR